MIVLGTVLLNATTARLFSRLIGVFLTKSNGILIIGASKLSRLLGHYLVNNGRHVVLIDSNQNNIEKAQELGLDALSSDIYSDTLSDNIELNDVGYIMAMTGNSDINSYIIEKFSKEFGENGSYRLVTSDEMNFPEKSPKEGLFSPTDDYINLMEVTRKYPAIQELDIDDAEHYETLIELASKDQYVIPLFLKDDEGELHIISVYDTKAENIGKGFKLVYLGKPFDVEKIPLESD